MGKDYSDKSGAYFFHCTVDGVCNHPEYPALNFARAARECHELRCYAVHVINYRDKVVA